MEAKKIFFSSVIFFFGLHFLSVYGEERVIKRKTEAEAKKSLIRMELLLKKKRAFDFPKRDIFSPQGSLPRVSAGEDNVEGSEGSTQQKGLDFHYVGFIRSQQKYLGLILFEGQALTVSEGDVIGGGTKILKVTDKEIEILGPDGKTQKFALEGEGK